MTCDSCERYRNSGARFCPVCGRPLGNVRPPVPRRVREHRYGFVLIAGLIAAVQGVLILLFELIAVWIKAGFVLDDVADKQYPLYYITPHLETLVDLNGTGISVLFMAEVLIVTVCVGTLIVTAARKLRDNNGDLCCLKDTAAYEVPVVMGITLIAELVYILAVIATGTDLGTTSSTEDTGFMIFQYVNASVYEEFLCRILMLGLPCLVVALMVGRLKSPWWKYLIGGAKFEKWMIVFVIFSAAMFGAAHLDNWGSWKFIPTFAFGLAAGYLFLKYGIYATVAIHFLNDALNAGSWVMDAPGMLMLGLIVVGICSLPCIARYIQDVAVALRALKKAP